MGIRRQKFNTSTIFSGGLFFELLKITSSKFSFKIMVINLCFYLLSFSTMKCIIFGTNVQLDTFTKIFKHDNWSIKRPFFWPDHAFQFDTLYNNKKIHKLFPSLFDSFSKQAFVFCITKLENIFWRYIPQELVRARVPNLKWRWVKARGLPT